MWLWLPSHNEKLNMQNLMSKSDTGCSMIPNKTIKPKSFIQPLILLHRFISFQVGALCTSHLLTENLQLKRERNSTIFSYKSNKNMLSFLGARNHQKTSTKIF